MKTGKCTDKFTFWYILDFFFIPLFWRGFGELRTFVTDNIVGNSLKKNQHSRLPPKSLSDKGDRQTVVWWQNFSPVLHIACHFGPLAFQAFQMVMLSERGHFYVTRVTGALLFIQYWVVWYHNLPPGQSDAWGRCKNLVLCLIVGFPKEGW